MVKILKNLPIIVLVVIVAWLMYNYGGNAVNTVGEVVSTASGKVLGVVGLGSENVDENIGEYEGQAIDMGIYDVQNPNVFGTTAEEERRVTNDGVRKEYHVNPFPWGECTCSSGHCDKHGIPNPAPGNTHICKNGFPSKRIVDMYGGHFQLNHICAPATDGPCNEEPAVLGRWWCKKGCSNAESVGLNVRPICSRCK